MSSTLSNMERKLARARYESAFKNYPSKEMFRLFIDAAKQEDGEFAFDKGSLHGDKPEPGYRDGMLNGFAYMEKTIGQPLNVHELKTIRAMCINKVENLKDDDIHFKPGKYGINLKHVSKTAMHEWESEKLILTLKARKILWASGFSEEEFSNEQAKYAAYFDEKNEISSQFSENDNISEMVDNLFADFYAAIAKATSEDEKLGLIVSLCRRLEISHLFGDANQRTIVFVVLNKLLIENDFSPVILEDPIVFNGYHSKAELIQDVKIGMKNFLSYKTVTEEEDVSSSQSSSSASPLTSNSRLIPPTPQNNAQEIHTSSSSTERSQLIAEYEKVVYNVKQKIYRLIILGMELPAKAHFILVDLKKNHDLFVEHKISAEEFKQHYTQVHEDLCNVTIFWSTADQIGKILRTSGFTTCLLEMKGKSSALKAQGNLSLAFDLQKLCEKLQERRIKFIRHEINLGTFCNLINQDIEKAKSEIKDSSILHLFNSADAAITWLYSRYTETQFK